MKGRTVQILSKFDDSVFIIIVCYFVIVIAGNKFYYSIQSGFYLFE